MTGDSCTAIIVYTGDLAHIKPKQVAQSFIDQHCHSYDMHGKTFSNQHMSSGRSKTGSSASSVKSGSHDSAQSSNRADYVSTLFCNVVQYAGYKHLSRYVGRQGKALLSLQKVVTQLSKQFTQEDWYYLRKIHKKTHNYFLDKSGKRGSSGGGWLSTKTKSAKSASSKGEQKPNQKVEPKSKEGFRIEFSHHHVRPRLHSGTSSLIEK